MKYEDARAYRVHLLARSGFSSWDEAFHSALDFQGLTNDPPEDFENVRLTLIDGLDAPTGRETGRVYHGTLPSILEPVPFDRQLSAYVTVDDPPLRLRGDDKEVPVEWDTVWLDLDAHGKDDGLLAPDDDLPGFIAYTLAESNSPFAPNVGYPTMRGMRLGSVADEPIRDRRTYERLVWKVYEGVSEIFSGEMALGLYPYSLDPNPTGWNSMFRCPRVVREVVPAAFVRKGETLLYRPAVEWDGRNSRIWWLRRERLATGIARPQNHLDRRALRSASGGGGGRGSSGPRTPIDAVRTSASCSHPSRDEKVLAYLGWPGEEGLRNITLFKICAHVFRRYAEEVAADIVPVIFAHAQEMGLGDQEVESVIGSGMSAALREKGGVR